MDSCQLENKQPWLDLLGAIEKLDIRDQLPIPQIAVFGDQSSGKSALLEDLSGIIFPRGSGLETKCPTHITMTKTEVGAPWSATLTFPLQLQSADSPELRKTVHSPEALAFLLEELVENLSKMDHSRIISTTIGVSVRSPHIPNLSLVDLPSYARTTTAGQDWSMSREVNDLLDSYMGQKETIILAVFPANQDIATVDVLERARKFDPLGVRTIGVITKPDLLVNGFESEVLHILRNEVKPLKLGYVLVKNRNQDHINDKVSILDCFAEEELFMSTQEPWASLDSNQRGMHTLCRQLTSLMISHGMQQAPILKWHVLINMSKVEERLSELGSGPPESIEERRKVLIRVVSRFSQTLRQLCAGDYRDQLARSDTDLRIKYHVGEIMQRLKAELSMCVPDLDNDAYSKRLGLTIKEMRGRELPGFGSTRLLLGTVSQELDSWRIHVETAISDIYTHYTKTANILAMKLMSQFPSLYDSVSKTLNDIVNSTAVEISRRVDEMFLRSTESAASDIDLIESINAIRYSRFEKTLTEVLLVAKDSDPPGHNTKDELKSLVLEMLGHTYMQYHALGNGPNLHVEDARAALKAYWRISEKRLNEDICTAIDIELLKNCSETVESELMSSAQLWLSDVGSDNLSDLISEGESTVAERRILMKRKSDIERILQKFEQVAPQCNPVRPCT